jgi:hypothetical protein
LGGSGGEVGEAQARGRDVGEILAGDPVQRRSPGPEHSHPPEGGGDLLHGDIGGGGDVVVGEADAPVGKATWTNAAGWGGGILEANTLTVNNAASNSLTVGQTYTLQQSASPSNYAGLALINGARHHRRDRHGPGPGHTGKRCGNEQRQTTAEPSGCVILPVRNGAVPRPFSGQPVYTTTGPRLRCPVAGGRSFKLASHVSDCRGALAYLNTASTPALLVARTFDVLEPSRSPTRPATISAPPVTCNKSTSRTALSAGLSWRTGATK